MVCDNSSCNTVQASYNLKNRIDVARRLREAKGAMTLPAQHLSSLETRSDEFLMDVVAMDIGSATATAVIARFDQSRFEDGLFTTLDVDRPDRLDRAVEKRKAEYLAGRAVAMAALASTGHASTQIATGPNREPIWPAGVAGSITHSKGRCAAIVTDQPGTLAGVDIEDIAEGFSLDAIFKVALQPEETRLIRESDAQALTATLVFSAKETLYKALFPAVKQFFGFDHAELHCAPSETILRLRLNKSLKNMVTAGTVFDIGYRQLDRSVITWLITPTPAD